MLILSNTNKLIGPDNSVVVTRVDSVVGENEQGKGGQYMATEETLAGEHTMQYMYDVLQNYTIKTHKLLNNVTPVKFNKNNVGSS